MAETPSIQEKQPRKPVQSWTKGSQKEWERRENGMISARPLFGRGEWALHECEEHTTWANSHLKKRRYRLISDLRKSISDGLTLVHLLDVLTDEKIHGIQNRPILRTQKVENLQKCLQYLQSKGVRIYGVTADSLADGNLRTILTLLSAIKDKFEPEVKPHGNAFSQDSQGIETGDGYRQGTVSDKVGYNIAYIPGTMASSQSDNELPPTDKIMSTTQLDKRKVEQHGANQRRQQLVGSNSTNVGPQPENIASIAINQPVRETLSLTVEERLKSLLDSPDLGGLAQSSAKPSHSEDKKEGPRVQRLLERQAPGSPTQKTSSVDVRMSPQSVHYKHAQTSSTSTNSSSLDPQSHQTQQRMPYWNSSDNLREACNILYNPAGNQQSSKQLPSYSEHLHRHPTSQQHWRDQSPNRPSDSGTVRQVLHRDGSPSHHHDYQSSPKRELQRKSQSLENSGSALRNDDTNPTRQNFESHASNSSTSRHIHSQHFRGQLHEQNQNRSDQHFRSAEGQQSQNSNRKQTNQTGGVLPMNRLVSQDSNYSTVSYNSITDSMTSSHTQMSFLTKLPSSIKTPRSHITGQMETSTGNHPNSEGRIDLELNYTPSESSSQSHTPPLPALSPDNTPPETPPGSPLANNHSRSQHLPVRDPLPFEQLAKIKLSRGSSDKRKKGTSRSSTTQMRLYPHSIFHRSSNRSRQKKRFDKNNLSAPIHEYPKSEDSYDNEDDTARDSETISLQIDTQDSYGMASESQTEDSTRPMHYDADSVRHQLIALEKMYQDILHVIGSNKDEKIPNTRFMGSQQSLQSRSRMRGSSRRGQREKDIRLVNKRFARVESHVVTLARSVAHLSSELRSQNSLLQEIESLKHEIYHLKELQMSRDFSLARDAKPITPSAANSHKIKKLTKFFGVEPPLLAIFLKQLGYEKYVPNFEKEKIGMIELPFLSEQRLERLGIPTGPRLRIMHEAQLMM